MLILGLVVMLCACNAQRRVLYLQDVESGSEIVLPENYIIRLKPLDQITVVVNSKNPELAMPFNTSTSYNALNGTVTNSTANESSLQVLTVDSKGYIALPVIGKVKVGGLTKPGRYNINKDQLTIFEALALAGDMTIYGNREDVAIIREKDGKSIVTKLDLRSQDIFSSPYFYIEQNDVIIVSPNKYKAATAEINQNRSFWISLTSTAISLATLVITILTVSK